MPQIYIPKRFNGPPGSGNGGYCAGAMAVALLGEGSGETAEVFLRAPPPLETELEIVPAGTGCECRHEGALVMTAGPGREMAPAPAAPPIAIAREAHKHFPPAEDHAFPGCFVCGPDRLDDGLCLFTGHIDGFDGVLDVWTPAADLAGDDGLVKDEILWSALDCPGAFAVGFQENPMVLGRIMGRILRRPPAGEELIVAGWSLFHEGRKHGAGTALYTADGELLAQTEQLWIELK
ncbi:hypothetical protein K1X12_16650 [Hyphomonas sp. WL0036]|uniref:hypothetical protein n=1 Tax=Hyphomonas sediminis TaxID=2866160 RepID=UPI001C803497|nr:hypothetical protein [Hyphomonas sediminis]MBY9068526.1 hypothetical protein [Hyphomonas sediminis]